jgi:hypothetical protein
VSETARQVANRFELLRLMQSRLGRPMVGHFGLQTEVGLRQTKIGLVQFKRSRSASAMTWLKCRPASDSAATNTTIVAASKLSVVDPCAQKRKAIGRPVARTKARSDGRCDALIAMAPAHMPPITMTRKSWPNAGRTGNRMIPPIPQHRPPSSEPQVAIHDQRRAFSG